MTSPDNSIPPDSFTLSCNHKFLEFMKKDGRDPSPGPKLEKWARDAGFVDIHVEKKPLPLGTWPADKRLVCRGPTLTHRLPWLTRLVMQKEVGAWNFLQTMEGLEGFIYFLFSKVDGYTEDELKVTCAKTRQELKDPKIHSMYTQ
jgi:hypothetical protein